MYVLSMRIEVHVPESRSLKHKRAAIKPIVEGARRRYGVSAAEVAYQQKWQRSSLGFVTVASGHTKAVEVIDAVERYVWSFPEIQVMAADRLWLEES